MLKKKKMKKGWLFVPGPDSSEEELIKYAKNNYPIGTKYYCPFNIRDVEVKDSFKFYKKGEGNGLSGIVNLKDHILITDGCGGCVYFDGKWSKKI